MTDKPVHPTLDFHFGLEALGNIEISERGKETSVGTFPNSVVLAQTDEHRINISITVDDEVGPAIRMDAYHCENPETGLGYHAHMSIPLDRRTAGAFHKALGYLVDML